MIIAKGTDLQTYQGDSFTITFNVSGLNPDASYSVYFQLNFKVKVEKNATAMTDNNGELSVVFRLLSSETDVLARNYTWGLKGCFMDSNEDTWKTGNITILPKVVEGCV